MSFARRARVAVEVRYGWLCVVGVSGANAPVNAQPHQKIAAMLAGLVTPQPGASMAGNVRYWHKADVQTALMNVRFEGNNGHDADVTRCLLMILSGTLDFLG